MARVNGKVATVRYIDPPKRKSKSGSVRQIMVVVIKSTIKTANVRFA